MSRRPAAALAGTLIAVDVDGTLLRSDGSLSARTVAAIASAARAGAQLTLATGRDWHAVGQVLDQLPEVGHALCVNGIEVFDRSGTELFAGELDPDVARSAVAALRQAIPGIVVGAGIDGDLIGEAGVNSAMPPGVANPIEVADIVEHLGPGLRDLVLYHADLSVRLDEFHTLVATTLAGHHGVQVAFTGLPMVELTPPGSGKHSGLAWLSSHLGIDQSSVVAFGDGRNDISMLEWAGTGVAMGHASPEVQACADEITLAVEDDGVAHWLERAA